MQASQATLTIDFGDVGRKVEPFSLRIHSQDIVALIEQASQAHRVYELMLITRPGDVWRYLWVECIQLPKVLEERVAQARKHVESRNDIKHPWPENWIPFEQYDVLFSYYHENTVDDSWLDYRRDRILNDFVTLLLGTIKTAQTRIGRQDALIQHIQKLITSGTHSYDYLSQTDAITSGLMNPPFKPLYSKSFYEKVKELLRDGAVSSVAHIGRGDYTLLRLLAAVQRERADRTGHYLGDALQITALVNAKVNIQAWDASIGFSEEGVGHGDLLIHEGSIFSNAKKIVEMGRSKPGRYILSMPDCGDIAGYEKFPGDGWAFYSKHELQNRRECMNLRFRRDPVFRFEKKQANLFSMEKTMIVVGETVTDEVRSILAQVIREWQHTEFQPLLLVMGNVGPFITVGCSKVHILPEEIDKQNEEALADWVSEAKSLCDKWVDVVMLLEAEPLMQKAINNNLNFYSSPWQPWIISSSPLTELNHDWLIEGDLAEQLTLARQSPT